MRACTTLFASGVMTLCIATAFAADNDSTPSNDIKDMCAAQQGVCVSVCPADDGSFNKGLLHDLCIDDCQDEYIDCVLSASRKKEKYKVTKPKTGNDKVIVAP